MTRLTKRQTEVLELIKDWIRNTGYPPTRRDISDFFNFKSPNAAEEHLKALERKGVLRVIRNTSRGIRLLGLHSESELGVIGRVAAGSPIFAEEHIEETVNIPRTMFDPKADFLLRVHGDSMINVGIFEGDLLAVHKTQDVRNGQIIVARIGDEVTVKRFHRDPGSPRVTLFAENPDYSPITVDLASQGFEIEGRSVGLLRRGL